MIAKMPVLLLISNTMITSVWLKKHLENEFHIIHVTKGRLGLEKVESTLLDLVILDESIRDIEPLTLAQKIKRAFKAKWAPLLLITTNLKKSFRKKALTQGITGFLNDPIDESELRSRLAMSLKLAEMHEKIQKTSNRLSQTLKTFTDDLKDRAIKAIDLSKEKNEPFSIALVKLDQFEEIEHSLSEKEKHQLLFDFSEFLVTESSAQDVVIPDQDGKAVVVLPGMTLEEAQEKAQTLIKDIQDKTFSWKGKAFTLSVVITEDRQASFETMITRVDQAMTKKKNAPGQLIALKEKDDE